MEPLIQNLIEDGTLHTPGIIEAFRKVKRGDFIHSSERSLAGADHPIPIGHGQTNSQPYTVAFMLEKLAPNPGNRILDVGYGSGWTIALFASIVGPEGHVFGVERIPALASWGKKNISAYSFNNISLHEGDGSLGLPDHAPFDRIQVAAAIAQVPKALVDQLASPGRMIIPIGEPETGFSQDLVVIEKDTKAHYHEERFPGFAFVPLVVGTKRAGYTDET